MNAQHLVSYLKLRTFSFSRIIFLFFPILSLSIRIAVAQTGHPIKIQVDVDLVAVEVYAVDGKGNPVVHLKKEDFRLYEDGKLQKILNFDEVNADSNPLPSQLPILDIGNMPRGKTVLIIFDETTIPDSKSGAIRDAAAAFVRKNMQPRDMFAVASWKGIMQILQNLTDDRQSVLSAIALPSPGRAWGPFEDMLRALEQISYSIASINGQKAVLIFGRTNALYPRSTLADSYARTLTAAKRSNVHYYMVDPEPAMANTPELSIIQAPSGVETGNPQASSIPVFKMPSASYGLRSLVADSGGYSIGALEDVDQRLDTLGRQLSSYYILGYQPGNQKHDGSFRRLKVSTRAKGIVLKHKAGYEDRRPVDLLASSKQEQALLGALASPAALSGWPITFRPSYFYDSPDLARVLIDAAIRTDKMSFRKKGERMRSELSLMGAAYAENGAIAARFSETLPVEFDTGQKAALRDQDLIYRGYLRLRPGKYRLKLAVSDEAGKVGSTEQYLEVPRATSRGLVFSSLVVAEQFSTTPDSIQDLRTQLMGNADPLIYSNAQIRPSVKHILPAGSPISVFFRMYSFHGNLEPAGLRAGATLLDATGNLVVATPLSLSENIRAGDKTGAAAFLTFRFPNLPEGKYHLVIELSQPDSPEVSILQTDLEFAK